ncbi:MAG: D-alanine--D-alanine ligase [Campylobacterota bacterium]|nr:D-alanine--D-alanine ligase [Campylobacterota bacterium]
MKIAIVFGSQSFEHEISIVSAIAMKKVLTQNELLYIFIDKNREFYHIPTATIKSNLFSSGEYKKCDKLQLSHNGFTKKGLFSTKALDFDVVLNLTHGGDGEDGVLAGLFKFYNIPFIGPRVEASVVSCNKYLSKGYSEACGVKTINFKYYNKNDKIEVDNFPVIIKPIRLGSSIGVSIVKSQSDLNYALDVAFEFDDEIIIEPFINNVKEYNLAGCKYNGEFKFSIVEEPQKEEFLDFDKKYLDFNRTQQVSKADIEISLEDKLKKSFAKIYNNTFEGSLIRCDFFVVENEVYLNEINPIPGSMSNYLFGDFSNVINSLASDLPKDKYIQINYEYVNKIQSAKGKI